MPTASAPSVLQHAHFCRASRKKGRAGPRRHPVFSPRAARQSARLSQLRRSRRCDWSGKRGPKAGSCVADAAASLAGEVEVVGQHHQIARPTSAIADATGGIGQQEPRDLRACRRVRTAAHDLGSACQPSYRCTRPVRHATPRACRSRTEHDRATVALDLAARGHSGHVGERNDLDAVPASTSANDFRPLPSTRPSRIEAMRSRSPSLSREPGRGAFDAFCRSCSRIDHAAETGLRGQHAGNASGHAGCDRAGEHRAQAELGEIGAAAPAPSRRGHRPGSRRCRSWRSRTARTTADQRRARRD